MTHALIIEDEAALAVALAEMCRRMGFGAETAPSAAKGLRAIAASKPDIVLLDIGLPDRSGMDVLHSIRADGLQLPVLVITAHGSLQNAVEAKKRGATDYLVKPIDLHELETKMRAVLEAADGAMPTATAAPSERAPLLIGSCAAMQPAFAAIAHACSSDVPVLLAGPAGIGKSLTARVVHLHSARHRAPFVQVSCTGLGQEQLESDMQRAKGGTLFLDDVGDLAMPLQVQLLQVLEDKERAVDLRVLSATNQDLDAAVADKTFREDLLYRLRVLEVLLPPLAQRTDDLPALCSYMLAGIAGDRRLALAQDAFDALQAYAWPGNVRELRNVLERAAAICNDTVIRADHLPDAVQQTAGQPRTQANDLDQTITRWVADQLRDGRSYQQLHDDIEGKLLATLLPHYGGKPTVLANALKMNRATLRRKLRDLLGGTPNSDD